MRPCQFQSSRRPLGQPINDASPPKLPRREFALRSFYKISITKSQLSRARNSRSLGGSANRQLIEATKD